MDKMFYPNLILTLMSLLSFVGILGVFIFFEKRSYRAVWPAFIVIFLSILVQMITFIEPTSRLDTSKNNIDTLGSIEYSYITLSILSSIFIVYLLSIFHALSDNEKAISFSLGAFQIAIFMSITSLNSISVHLKILLNIYYLCIPALAIYKLTIKNDS